MVTRAKAFYKDKSGATAIEYALIASMVSIVIVGAVAALGSSQDGMYAHIRDNIVPAIENALGGAKSD